MKGTKINMFPLNCIYKWDFLFKQNDIVVFKDIYCWLASLKLIYYQPVCCNTSTIFKACIIITVFIGVVDFILVFQV